MTKGGSNKPGPDKPKRGPAKLTALNGGLAASAVDNLPPELPVQPEPTPASAVALARGSRAASPRPARRETPAPLSPDTLPPLGVLSPPARTARGRAKAAPLAPPPPAFGDPLASMPLGRPAQRVAPASRQRADSAAITITRPDRTEVRMDVPTRRNRRESEALRIFQIYYEPWHIELLDPAFEPLDNRGVASEYLEVDVFNRLAASPALKDAPLWGALSWRFGEKTGLTGDMLRDTVAANSGFDVYYCNPYPENEALFHNMWMQGETCHPRFLEIARAVFAAAGLPDDELIAVESSEMFSAANYFIGTPKFWSLYLAFVRRVVGLSDSRMSREMRELLHSQEADRRGMHNGATYLVFIIERLFPVFLKTSGRHLTTFKVPLADKETELNVHLRLLREMKDVAHKTKSAWLAACWINYRNLYFSQSSGRDWCASHLRNITPTSVRFG